jgi:hypothetical protein
MKKSKKPNHETRIEKIERLSRAKTRKEIAEKEISDRSKVRHRKQVHKKHTFTVVYAKGLKPVFK